MRYRWDGLCAGHRLALVGRTVSPGEEFDSASPLSVPGLVEVIPVEPIVEAPAAPADVPEPIEPPAKRSRRKGQN